MHSHGVGKDYLCWTNICCCHSALNASALIWCHYTIIQIYGLLTMCLKVYCMHNMDRLEKDSIGKRWCYFDVDFAVSSTSQPELFDASVFFFFHSRMLAKRLSEPRAVCFLDHLVTVTWSSTWTSLTTDFEKWFSSSSRGGTEDGEGEKGLPLGEDGILPSGLICVATSFLKTAAETVEADSLLPSDFSSACESKYYLVS